MRVPKSGRHLCGVHTQAGQVTGIGPMCMRAREKGAGFPWARVTEEARDGVTFTHLTEEVREMYPDVPSVWALALPFALSSSVNTD